MSKYDVELMFDFLRQIKINNNTEWFHANKDFYEKARDGFKAMSQEILTKMQTIDSKLQGLELKNCIFRFNRDTRFSLDKSPYKRHFGVYLVPGGKKKVGAGYYLHLQPLDKDDEEYGQSLLDVGIYMPPSKAAKIIREEIFYGGGEKLQNFLSREDVKDRFTESFETDNLLKVLPKNLKNSPYDELIRHKNWDLVHLLSDEDCFRADFIDFVIDTFRIGKDWNDFFNDVLDGSDFESIF
ncbi:MAG: DUF2461 domain-containing protein [Bacteroidales bacterium]|nr:DUF2461 domain-containing protein [Bacteroidales bacterium]